MKSTLSLLLLVLSVQLSGQKYEGLVLTPPMGWNSWNSFQTNINEKTVMEMADAMVSTGLRDLGYKYLILDDGWMAMERDNAGNLLADPTKFPRGMKVLSDYVHAKGLKFGLYNCAGTRTCAGFPGTRGYEYQDARLYASWEIDYLKYDWCYTEGINPVEAYTTMSKALKSAGRPIVFSICEWGGSKPWLWAKNVGHLWRTTGDIYRCFDCIQNNGNWSALGVTKILDMQDTLHAYAGPGHWNDPDMLEVGNGMSLKEDKTHFSLWSMLAAPLIAGNDIRRLSKETLAILANKEVIAINQDALGAQAFTIPGKDSIQIWIKPMTGGGWAVCFFNQSLQWQKLNFNWKTQLPADTVTSKRKHTGPRRFHIRNVWTKKPLGATNKTLRATIASHDVLMVRLK